MKKIKISLLGLFAGIICGLFASGGGLILVPAFTYLLQMDDRKARGTSTICILPMVATSSLFYYKGNFIDFKVGIIVATGGVLGGIVGAKLLRIIPVKYVRIMFIIFLFYVSIRMILLGG